MTKELPPPTGEAFYYITPEEGGASDMEAMWLAEDNLAEHDAMQHDDCRKCGTWWGGDDG